MQDFSLPERHRVVVDTVQDHKRRSVLCHKAHRTCFQGFVLSAHLAYLTELARTGFVVASVEYRTSNEGPYPMPLIDIMTFIPSISDSGEAAASTGEL